ncbi:MAG: peptidase domain-containing ABC transporter [Beijerinckiaceae bacterium]
MSTEGTASSPVLPGTGLPAGSFSGSIMRALGTPSHPIADLRRLAARLGGSGSATLSDVRDIEGIPGPQLLHELGERLGLQLTLATRDIATLTTADCPCVVLLQDGTSRLLIEAPENGAMIVAGDGTNQQRVDRRALAAAANGGVFQARRIDPDLQLKRQESVLEAGFAKLHPQATSRPAATQASPPSRHPIMAYLLKVCSQKRNLVISLAMAGFLSGLISLAVPVFTMVVFDRVIPHGAFETLWALIIGVVVLLGLDFALRHVRHALSDSVAVAGSTGLGAQFFSRLLHSPLSSMPKDSGALVQPYQDMNHAAHLAPQFIAGLMVDLPFFLIVLGFLGMLGGWIAIIPAIGAVLLLVLHAVAHRLATRDMGDEARLQQRQTQMLVDAVSSSEMIRTTGSGPSLLMRWEERSDAAAFVGHKMRSQQNLAVHAGAVVMQMVTVITVAAGAYAVSASAMTVGALSACMMLAGRAIMPVATLMTQGYRLKHILQTTSDIGQFLSSPPEQGNDTSGRQSAVAGPVQLNGITFRHAGSELDVIASLSLKIEAGERVAIIGKSGCGKSTLLKLLARLHDASSGSIHIGGRDIRQIDPLVLRQSIALMPQVPHLFDTTLAQNMTAGLGPVPADWFDHVAALTGVADFANRQPAGFSLETGTGGNRLSGGERQSTALARAIMGKPSMLLLDEPTAAMDNEREARIVNALAAELQNGALKDTGLVIATHRMPILALVTRIIWLDGGKIVADGPKDEIFRKFGLAA